MDKVTIRKQLLKQRRALSSPEVATKSHAIREKLLRSVDWSLIKKLHIYSAVEVWNEVGTGEIINHLAKTYPHITIISQPARKDQPAPSEQFDLIIVPVLGFDKDNYRLGLGGGWYDRFLATQPWAQKIGLAYSFTQVHKLPHEKHDIALDSIITEV